MPPRPPIQFPSLPSVADPALQQYLADMHSIVYNLHTSGAVPNPPTNLTVTPIAGGNNVAFTRSNAVSYVLFIGNNPTRALARQVNLGTANAYTDQISVGGATRYYWVQGLNQSGQPSSLLGPKTGVTLPLGTPASPSTPPPQSFAKVFDTTINANRPVISTVDPQVSGLPSSPPEISQP